METERDGITADLQTMLERLEHKKSNGSEDDFRGRMTSTLIGLVGCVQHLDKEVKALREAANKTDRPPLKADYV